MKTVFEINNYKEACKFLQDKYDAQGLTRLDYYHEDKLDGHLVKTSKVGQGKIGLQYHHICEDKVPSLSNLEVAEKNPIEYQKAENMCYCNLLEHAWLHILITENNTEASDEDQFDITGKGGVRWMMLALNSIMCNADISWYSSKNEEGKGMNYNYNNIITGNKDQYLKVINRFCTSAFIRQRLNKTSDQLADMICMMCKKDGTEGGRLDIYATIKGEANNTYLFDWNVNAYADLENYLRDNQSALVYICTGGGKTTTGLEYLRLHDGKALALGPSDTVKDSWKDNKNVDPMNYQTFMDCYATIDWAKYSVVICDEAHHIKAERWGAGIRWLLENKKDIKIIGLTATPTKEQFEGTDKEFGGRICYGLDLATGIKNGDIHAFSYISSIYKMADVKEEFESYGTNGTILWERLNIKLNENPIEKILKKHMPEGQRKIIVFCSSISDIDYAKNAMLKYDPTLDMRVITSKENKEDNKKAKEWFNTTTDHNVCLITVSMVNEGAHYNDVNTLVMFRRTNSSTLYLQQLGRVVVTTRKKNPNGIVFDFTNNAENLIYNNTITITEAKDGEEIKAEDLTEDEKKDIIKSIKSVIKNKANGKEVIHKDYTEDCVKTLNTLNEAKKTTTQDAIIYTTFRDLKEALTKVGEDFFVYDLWADLKTADGNIKIKRPKHVFSKELAEEIEKETGADLSKVHCERVVVKASDVEKLAVAFRTAIRRLYNFGYMNFKDDHECAPVILNDTKFKEVIEQVGFKSEELFKNVMNKIAKHTLLIAMTAGR